MVTSRSRIHGVLGCKDNERAARRHNISDVLSQLETEALEPVGGELKGGATSPSRPCSQDETTAETHVLKSNAVIQPVLLLLCS